MRRLFDVLPLISKSSSSVLIEGASGTGKELVARAIHGLSPRENHRFVPINCGALPDTLLESELFGHKAGAFTDAKRDKAGRFTLAHKGTILLDEIGDISPAMQVRLLRVLQDNFIEPLGAEQPVPVDVRVVAATNKNLSDLVQRGRFRDDLYYRIRVIHLKLPMLRDRREDVPLLVQHLLDKFNRLQGICRGIAIELRHLPPELRIATAAGTHSPNHMSLKAMEKFMIAAVLRRHHGNRNHAAQELGINPSTLYRKIKASRLQVPETDGRGRKK